MMAVCRQLYICSLIRCFSSSSSFHSTRSSYTKRHSSPVHDTSTNKPGSIRDKSLDKLSTANYIRHKPSVTSRSTTLNTDHTKRSPSLNYTGKTFTKSTRALTTDDSTVKTRSDFRTKRPHLKEPNLSHSNTKYNHSSVDRSKTSSRQSYGNPKPHTSLDYLDYQIEGIPVLSEEIPSNDHVPSFQELGLNSRLCAALAREEITTPTPIQIRALPHTLTNHHSPCIVHSETGTGKTLVYLLPALQDTRPGLTTLIVTPTRELAVQVYLMAKKLAGTRKDARRVGVVFSGHNEAELLEECRSTRPHILVGTPRILERFIQEEPRSRLAGLQRLVLDEGDNLMKSLTHYASWAMKRNRERHPKSTRLLTQHLLKLRSNLELICTSATIPKPFREELIEIGWGVYPTVISTVNNCKIPEAISHHYIECSAENKLHMLVDHFKSAGRKQALVFIHRKASIEKFISDLTALGIRARPLYLEVLDMENYESFLNNFRNGDIEMVVGTEETVRGLDFDFVETLYLTEVPRTSIEYLHMAGRVGRMGREGLVVTLVEKEEKVKEEVDTSRMRKLKTEVYDDWREYERQKIKEKERIAKEKKEVKEREGVINKLTSRLVRMYNVLGVTAKSSNSS